MKTVDTYPVVKVSLEDDQADMVTQAGSTSRDLATYRKLITLLQPHAGENGRDEGAVEVLQRLLHEHGACMPDRSHPPRVDMDNPRTGLRPASEYAGYHSEYGPAEIGDNDSAHQIEESVQHAGQQLVELRQMLNYAKEYRTAIDLARWEVALGRIERHQSRMEQLVDKLKTDRCPQVYVR